VLIARSSQYDPQNGKALYLRGNSFVKKRHFEEGIRDYDTLLSFQPSHVEGLYSRGSFPLTGLFVYLARLTICVFA
jgi:hypothetical protein